MRTLALAAVVALAACKSEPAIAAPQVDELLDKLRVEIDERYSYRDRLGLDWKQLFAAARTELAAATTRDQVVRGLVALLAHARDAHLDVIVDGKWIATDPAVPVPNFDLLRLKNRVSAWRHPGKCLSVGTVDGFAYALVNSLDGKRCDTLKADWSGVYASLAAAPGLILDLRGNSGGDEMLALHIAGHFVERATPYAKHAFRDPAAKGGFGPEFIRKVEPVRGAARWTKPVVVLIGPLVMSSAESFVLMMRAAGAPLLGGTTRGASANPRIVELGQGISVRIPSWRETYADGKPLEGIGIPPDIAAAPTAVGDAVIDAAVTELRRRSNGSGPPPTAPPDPRLGSP